MTYILPSTTETPAADLGLLIGLVFVHLKGNAKNIDAKNYFRILAYLRKFVTDMYIINILISLIVIHFNSSQ